MLAKPEDTTCRALKLRLSPLTLIEIIATA